MLRLLGHAGSLALSAMGGKLTLASYTADRILLVVSDTPPKSVGLAGDGDEIDAFTDVERAFAVKLDHSDAPHWRTAGDVFNSLKHALPPGERDRADLCDKFVMALSGQTFADPSSVMPESPLLASSHPWRDVQKVTLVLWVVAFVCLVGAVLVALV